MYIRFYSVNVLPFNKSKRFREDENGYVFVPHNSKYVLQLKNNNSVRCEAKVVIDGEEMGIWIIDPYSNIRLERPANEDGHFTFFKSGTKSFKKADLEKVPDNYLGLVSVTFTPERKRFFKPAKKQDFGINYTWNYNPRSPSTAFCDSNSIYQDSTTADEVSIYNSDSDNWQTIGNLQKSISVGHSGIGGSSNGRSYDYGNAPCAAAAAAPGGTGLSDHSSQMFYTVNGLDLDESQAVTVNLRLVCEETSESVRPKKPYANPIPPPVKEKKRIRAKKPLTNK